MEALKMDVLPEFEPGFKDVEVEPLPGEGSVTHHYRAADGNGKCGAVKGSIQFGKKWSDVNCLDCLASRKPRGSKSEKEPTKKPMDPQAKAEVLTSIEVMTVFGVNLALFNAKRPPAPVEPVRGFGQAIGGVLDHYGLLDAAEHPLATLGVHGLVLFMAVRDLPTIEDNDELKKAHGFDVEG